MTDKLKGIEPSRSRIRHALECAATFAGMVLITVSPFVIFAEVLW